MLFDLGMSELLLIGVVALVVIGPKDLPKALRVAGFWVKKARTLSREFQSSVEQMIREAELDEMRQELKKATEIDLDEEFRQTIDPTGSLAESLKPPELPKFSDADLPAAPAPETPPQPLLEPPKAEAAEPATPAIALPPDAAADSTPAEGPLRDITVTPAQAGEECSRRNHAAPGFPLPRE
jgi:sec-independent protein translocase protein TatB